MITVALVDDHALIRSGFAMIVGTASDMTVVGEAANGREGVALAVETRPDVILMDITMPEVDGIEATAQICSHPELADTRIIVITTFDNDKNILRALDAGASGFVGKNVEPVELLSALRVIAGGSGALVFPDRTRELLKASDATEGPLDPAQGEVERLTARELDVVAAVAQGLNNAEIAERLYISGATVKTHLNRALRKLSARDRVHLVIHAYRTGLVGTRPTPDS